MGARRRNPRPPRQSRRGFLKMAALAALAAPALGAEGQPQPAADLAPLDLPLPPDGSPDEAYWEQVRGQLLLEPGLTYMNNGSLGPMPRPVLEASARMASSLAGDPIDYHRNDDREATRRGLAAFVGVEPDTIALARSTTEGMNILAQGLDWRAGDEVVLCTHEHPGGTGAYRSLEARRGVRLRWVTIPTPAPDAASIVAAYEAALTERTRLLVVSHISFVTGLVMPVRALADLAHGRGLLISVDGAHPLGMLQLDLPALGCDHYAASGQKWLLGGTGTGLCYIHPELQPRVWPLMGHADAAQETAETRGARKYELSGQHNVPAVAGLGAAVALQGRIGPGPIEQRVRALGDRLRTGLAEIPGVRLWTPTESSLCAGLTSFSLGSIANTRLAQAIRSLAGIYCLPMPAGGLDAVRVSTHFYNTPPEVDRLLEAVREIADNELDYA